MKENTIATNFKPHECVIFVQSTKIDTHENKAIHSMLYENVNMKSDKYMQLNDFFGAILSLK